MKVHLLVPAVFLACGICGTVSSALAAGLSMPFITVEKGVYSAYSRFGEANPLPGPTLLVFTSADEFAAFWKMHHENVTPVPPLPAVDFSRYTVAVAMDVVEPTGGYMVEIRELTEGEDEVRVSAVKTAPGRMCIATQALTQPYHVIRMEKSGKRHVLNLTETVRECDDK